MPVSGDYEFSPDENAHMLAVYLQNKEGTPPDLAQRIAANVVANPKNAGHYADYLDQARAAYGEKYRSILFNRDVSRAAWNNDLPAARAAEDKYGLQIGTDAKPDDREWLQQLRARDEQLKQQYYGSGDTAGQYVQRAGMGMTHRGITPVPYTQPAAYGQSVAGVQTPPHSAQYMAQRPQQSSMNATMRVDQATPQQSVVPPGPDYTPLAQTMRGLIDRGAMTPDAAAVATRHLFAPVMSHPQSQAIAQQVQSAVQQNANARAPQPGQQAINANDQARTLSSLAMIFGGAGY